METLLQDLRYGLRVLRKKPTFTIVAVLTLALGVGANTAIFSIVDAVLLRSLPYRDPDRLVRIFFNEPGAGLRDVEFSKPELDDLQTRAGVFEDVTPIFEGSENLTGAQQPERLEAVNASFSYFSMLGATPQIGRLFGPQDFTLGFASVVVISDGLWRRAYGADPNVLGRTLRLDNDPYTIIGVLPRGFRHPGPTVSGDVDVFGAGGFSADPFPPPMRGTRILVSGIGRLKPGLTLTQAQARLTAMAAQLRHDFPTDYPPQAQWTIEIQPLQENFGGQCPAHAAGVTGCGNPDRFHRIVEYCQSSVGARFGAATRDGGAVSAGGEPRPHGATDADRVHAAVAHRRCRGNRNRSGYFGFHPALYAIERSPAQRSTNRLGGAGLRSADFHSYRLSVWTCSSASFGKSRSLRGHS